MDSKKELIMERSPTRLSVGKGGPHRKSWTLDFHTIKKTEGGVWLDNRW